MLLASRSKFHPGSSELIWARLSFFDHPYSLPLVLNFMVSGYLHNHNTPPLIYKLKWGLIFEFSYGLLLFSRKRRLRVAVVVDSKNFDI